MSDREKVINEQQKEIEELEERIAIILEGQPEIIRCKDCKHHGTMDCPMCEEGNCIFHTADNWYCADGERQEGL